MKLLAVMLCCAACASAGEYAVFASGARIYAERHEIDGATLTLYSKTGSTEMDRAMVVRFEPDDPVPPPPANPSPVTVAADPKLLADNAASKYGLPAGLVRAVVAAESGYRVDAVSPKGAIGLMQLMPETARELGVDPHNAAENVDAGARYLRNLLLKYDGHAYHALAAYNAGPGAVDKYHGVPPYRETQMYILNVLRQWRKQQTD
jgi:Transglycosylase SLT domain